MQDIEPGRTSKLRKPDPDKLQQIIETLKKRYQHLTSLQRRLRILAEIERMDLTVAQRREIFRRLRYKTPAHVV